MAKDCPEGAPLAELAVVLSTATAELSVCSEVIAIENEVIARFLRGACICAAKKSGDFNAIAGALAYCLAGQEARKGGEAKKILVQFPGNCFLA